MNGHRVSANVTVRMKSYVVMTPQSSLLVIMYYAATASSYRLVCCLDT